MGSRDREVDGSIRPYRGRYRAKYKGKHLGVFDTYEEAAIALASWKGLLAAQKNEAGAIVTLRNFGERWLDEREKEGVVRSVDRERSCWRCHVLNAPFVDWPLKRITQHDIQKWLRKLAQTEAVSAITTGRREGDERAVVRRPTGEVLKPKTIGNIRHVLKQCFVQAVIERKITNNPITEDVRMKIRAAVTEDEEETWTFLTVLEIAAVMRTLPSARHKAFFALAIYAGLRQGEILGLRRRDLVFDPEKPQIKVRRNRNGPVKTPKSRREVPMLYPAYEALREWLAECDLQAVRGRHSRDVIVDINRLVFPSDHGGCFAKGYDMGWADRRYRKKKDGPVVVYEGWRSKSGVARAMVTFHCLRHTCASMLMMGGRDFPKLDKFETGAWLGHSSSKVTERYAHLDPAFLNERVGRLFKFRLEEASQRAAADAEDG